MKHLFSYVLGIAAALSAALQPLQAQWTDVNGPTDFISSLAVIDDAVFAGSMTDGLFRTTNNGSAWATVTPSECTSINALVADGIFRYTPSAGWTAVNNGLPNTKTMSLCR